MRFRPQIKRKEKRGRSELTHARAHARAEHKYETMSPDCLPRSSDIRWLLEKHRGSKGGGSSVKIYGKIIKAFCLPLSVDLLKDACHTIDFNFSDPDLFGEFIPIGNGLTHIVQYSMGLIAF